MIRQRFTVEIPPTVRQDPNFADTSPRLLPHNFHIVQPISTNFFFIERQLMGSGWKETLRSIHCISTENETLKVENDEKSKKSEV